MVYGIRYTVWLYGLYGDDLKLYASRIRRITGNEPKFYNAKKQNELIKCLFGSRGKMLVDRRELFLQEGDVAQEILSESWWFGRYEYQNQKCIWWLIIPQMDYQNLPKSPIRVCQSWWPLPWNPTWLHFHVLTFRMAKCWKLGSLQTVPAIQAMHLL